MLFVERLSMSGASLKVQYSGPGFTYPLPLGESASSVVFSTPRSHSDILLTTRLIHPLSVGFSRILRVLVALQINSSVLESIKV